jgi:bacterioferritin (cytochrome b1)
MSTKEVQEQLVNSMKHWQQIENRSIESTAAVIAKTENPLIRLVMEIVQRDSQMHHRVQQMIIDSIEGKPIVLSTDEMGSISEMIDNHLDIENEMVGLVHQSLSDVKNKKMVVQEYLLNFLVEDEKKHASMLQALSKVKQGMYPYG